MFTTAAWCFCSEEISLSLTLSDLLSSTGNWSRYEYIFVCEYVSYLYLHIDSGWFCRADKGLLFILQGRERLFILIMKAFHGFCLLGAWFNRVKDTTILHTYLDSHRSTDQKRKVCLVMGNSSPSSRSLLPVMPLESCWTNLHWRYVFQSCREPLRGKKLHHAV